MIPVPAPRLAAWLTGPLMRARGLYGQAVVAAVLINLFGLATSLFSMVVFNKVMPNNAQDTLTALSIGMLLVIAFDFALRMVSGWFIDSAGKAIDRDIGAALFDRLQTMRLADKRIPNGALAGMLREFEALRDFFASATLTALVDLPFVLLFLAATAAVAGPLVLVPLVAIPLVAAIAWAAHPVLARLAAEGLNHGLHKQGVLVEAIAGLETVKTSRAGPLLAARWSRAVDGHARASLRQRLTAAIATNSAMTAQVLVYAVTVAWGAVRVGDGLLSTGALIAASMMAGRCVSPLAKVAALLAQLHHSRNAYRALDALMAGADEGATNALRRPITSGAIEFRNVGFAYPGASAAALTDVSFRIEAGERVALIGPIGSGKSTVARLILGLYEATSGQVLVDETDVRQLHADDLRAGIGSVLQDVVLLSGTVAENIGLGEADDLAVMRAAKLSGTHDFIGGTPGGYALQLADRGEGLSGGQRQSIAIARALAVPRPILILDEPTSAMDSASEAALIQRLDGDLAGRTVVVITHRTSMLKLVDRVIMLDGGRVATTGTRDAVLAVAA